MSVVVQCFHCSAILELDDGFRGGVCRCSSCGSLLQVPRGEDGIPTGKKVRPAMPPPPTSPTTPVQNATSSKLDVGISRGQFDVPSSSQIRRQDIGVSSGLGRVHQTTPIAPSSKQSRLGEKSNVITPRAAAQRRRVIFWMGLLLALLIIAMLASLVIYYIYYYEPALPLPPLVPAPSTR